MADINYAILQAIASLTQECRDGFERVEASQREQDTKIAKVETDMVKIKTIWTGLVLVFGFVLHAAKDWLIGGNK